MENIELILDAMFFTLEKQMAAPWSLMITLSTNSESNQP